MTDTLTPAALDEWERLARAAKMGGWWFPVPALIRDGFHPSNAEFIAFSSPERILGLIAAARQCAEARSLMAELVFEDDCSYDHHGYCQAHALQSRPCPHERAKRLLAAPEERDDA
jgi:hypothetical protein